MKFKNIKKKAKNIESPSNFQTIPEKSSFYFSKISSLKLIKLYGESLRVFVIFIFIVAVVIVGLDFQKNLQIKQGIDLQRQALSGDLGFWENFISQSQNYRDAYFQASILEYKLGNTSKAKIYVEKGLSLDPNSEDGRKLEKFIVDK